MITTVLSIAGFDGSGGAGMQADLKTFAALGCYGTTVLTALPIQNTQGVRNCYEIPLAAIEEQLYAIFEDIKPQSIKIGMLFKEGIIETVSDFLKEYAKDIPIVLDPVMFAKSGDPLLLPEAMDSLKYHLIPQVSMITPNALEASYLTGHDLQSFADMPDIAKRILSLGPKAVLVKGGHLSTQQSNDFYLDQEGMECWLEAVRITTSNTHGTGCTLSAAIAACLALGFNLIEACKIAKSYLQKALDAAKNESVGLGAGPVHHFYHFWPTLENLDEMKSYRK